MFSKIQRQISVCLAALLLVSGLWPAGSPTAASGTVSTSLGPAIEMAAYELPSDVSLSYTLFAGGVSDGQAIWMAPQETDKVVKLDPVTGAMTSYNNWPAGFTKGNGAFSDIVFDGQSLWMIPSLADRIIKLDPESGAMTGYNSWPAGFNNHSPRFSGGVFDGQYIWLVPSNANSLIRLDPSTGSMTSYNDWPSGFTLPNYAFSDGIYDGQNLWLVPNTASSVIKVDTATGDMTAYDDWPSGFVKGAYAFNGAIFDGDSMWMTPYSANQVVKLDTSTGEMTGYDDWPAGFNKAGSLLGESAFDGRYIWVKASSYSQLFRIDTTTGEMEGFSDWPAGVNANPMYSAMFDGLNVWLIPLASTQVIRVSSVPVMQPAIAGDMQADLAWEPVNGAIGYKIYQSQTMGSSGAEIATVGSSVYSRTVTGLTNGMTYYYSVKAAFAGRDSSASNEVSAIPLSTDANLSHLALSDGSLNPVFDESTTVYTAAVSSNVSEITVTPEVSASTAAVTINGEAAASGAPFGPLPLTEGANIIEVKVTAQIGTTKTYTVTVTRAAATPSPTASPTPTVTPAPTPSPISGGGISGGTSSPAAVAGINLNGTLVPASTIDTTKPIAVLEASPHTGSSAVYASIPASVLAGFASKNEAFLLEIKAPYGSYRIPVQLASLIPGLQELLAENKLGAQDISFKLTLTDKSGDSALRGTLTSSLPDGKLLGAPVHARMDIINAKTGMVLRALATFSSEMTILLPLTGDMKEIPEYWGAFRFDEATKQLAFVPARKLNIGGISFAAIRSASDGTYVVTENNVVFSDMSKHWGEPLARLAAAKGLVNGIGGGKFAPERTVTRAEFTAMLTRALGANALPASYAVDSQPLTREQMADMVAAAISKAEELPAGHADGGVINVNGYKDIASVKPAYLEAVRSIAELGIMTGTGGSRYEPQRETSRAQAAAVLIRTLIVLGKIDGLEG
ncbi:hypothetical protein BBD42_12770 [Paenibacillus sp. BIHB 4019]|uniref:SLH domain-containing protein n=1 Tax=Paenibacillus sp. BIHB 4019 TaxID=1870819 RepID=A0A1B2DHR9_9BACL|nr:S-layer homology domain-containing protein [Paenibacillus sp. BIHB 4019]ANY67243.1 hypothetical protein BBD42_12770 [Paenibacillus sp. BIHB 4019]